jgi:hypothetical protein
MMHLESGLVKMAPSSRTHGELKLNLLLILSQLVKSYYSNKMDDFRIRYQNKFPISFLLEDTQVPLLLFAGMTKDSSACFPQYTRTLMNIICSVLDENQLSGSLLYQFNLIGEWHRLLSFGNWVRNQFDSSLNNRLSKLRTNYNIKQIQLAPFTRFNFEDYTRILIQSPYDFLHITYNSELQL